VDTLEQELRRLSIDDARSVDSMLRADVARAGSLAPRDAALVRLGVLVALDGPPPAFERATSEAIANGATADEILGVLRAAAPLVGSSHVVAAAPRLARALGYDIDAPLESLTGPGLG
jgi:alkylhydroperoxidase/carboxymuconolactone decarboxylase family protein YurZ